LNAFAKTANVRREGDLILDKLRPYPYNNQTDRGKEITIDRPIWDLRPVTGR
jgi:hypothetical protein